MQRKIARWVIDHDPRDTRRCYAQLPVGTYCTCNQCKNFNAAVGRIFPTEFIALLDSLGIDPTKPAELSHYGRERLGLYLTGGWFHFVGSIVAGDDAIHWENHCGTFRFEQLGSGLEFSVTRRLALVREAFAGMSLAQLEFLACVPWVLAEPEPGA